MEDGRSKIVDFKRYNYLQAAPILNLTSNI